MNTTQQRKLLIKIQALESDIEELERVRKDIAKSGYASATMSSGGGSRSYTRQSLSELTKAIAEMKSELKSLRKKLNGNSVAIPNRIYTVYV